MEQQKIGQLLKELRKEKGLTQAQLAEQFGVSDRSVSRWETGVTLPDLSVLVELADFYEIDIRELIDGERKQAEEKKKSEEMKDTLRRAAEYADGEKQKQVGRLKKRIDLVFAGFGCLFMVMAFVVFPSESGWAVKFALLGAVLTSVAVFLLLEQHRLLVSVGIFIALLIGMIGMDFASVWYIRQPPRFSLWTEYSDTAVTYHAPFYTVIRSNRDTPEETYEIEIGESRL